MQPMRRDAAMLHRYFWRGGRAHSTAAADRFRPLRMAQVPLETQVQQVWDPDVDAEKRVPGLTVASQSMGVMRPRSMRMSVNQHWPSVWPAAATFAPGTVPLPVRQGYQEEPEKRPPPDKWGNLELMKIPNFLHLTPVAIEEHCKALKTLCTEWPSGLTDEKIEELRPIRLSTSSYVHAGPSLSDARTRRVTLTLNVDALKLTRDKWSKMRRLLGKERLREAGRLISLVTDRCPRQKQNSDYALYLLTVLYFEANKVENWESDRTLYDDEKRIFERSNVCQNIINSIQRMLIEYDRLVKLVDSGVTETYQFGDIQRQLDNFPANVAKIVTAVDPGADNFEEKSRKAILSDPSIVKFKRTWEQVMNSSDDRRWQLYADAVTELFGWVR